MVPSPNSDQIHSHLATEGWDYLVALAPENITFLTGCHNAVRALITERPSIVVWPRDGMPFMVAPEVEVAWLRSNSSIENIVSYAGATPEAIEALRLHVEGSGLGKGVAGVDMDKTPALSILGLETALSDWRLVDGSEALAAMRAVKSDAADRVPTDGGPGHRSGRMDRTSHVPNRLDRKEALARAADRSAGGGSGFDSVSEPRFGKRQPRFAPQTHRPGIGCRRDRSL